MKYGVSFTLRIEEELHKLLQKEAGDQKRSINNLITYILWDYFKNKNTKK